MASQWIDLKIKLYGLPELQRLCDMALDTEHIIELVERGILRGNVRPDYYINMKVMLYRLSTELVNISRRYADLIIVRAEDSTPLQEVDKLAEDLKSILELTAMDENEISNELTSRPLNFPRISSVIGKVKQTLDVYLMDVMNDVISFKKENIMFEFLMSLMRRRGIAVSPATLAKYKEAKGEAT